MYREKGLWCRHMKSTIFMQNLQTMKREKERERERQTDRQTEICLAGIKINSSRWGWDSEGSVHLMLVTVCDSRVQPEEGCGGIKGQAIREGERGKDWYARNAMICEPAIARVYVINQKQTANRQWPKR